MSLNKTSKLFSFLLLKSHITSSVIAMTINGNNCPKQLSVASLSVGNIY